MQTWLRTSHSPCSQGKSAGFAEGEMNSEPGSIVVLIVVADNNTDQMSTSHLGERYSVTLVRKASINVPIKQATTAEKKNASDRGRGFWLHGQLSHPHGSLQK